MDPFGLSRTTRMTSRKTARTFWSAPSSQSPTSPRRRRKSVGGEQGGGRGWERRFRGRCVTCSGRLHGFYQQPSSSRVLVVHVHVLNLRSTHTFHVPNLKSTCQVHQTRFLRTLILDPHTRVRWLWPRLLISRRKDVY